MDGDAEVDVVEDEDIMEEDTTTQESGAKPNKWIDKIYSRTKEFFEATPDSDF